MPKRIQRKRTKGWRMPKNSVYVGRPTKWGNPFFVGDDFGTKSVEEALEGYRTYIRAAINTEHVDLSEIKGKNIACWCPIDQPCHGDVLLDLLNQSTLDLVFRQKHTYYCRHVPTGEDWVVLAVNREHGKLATAGWPSSVANISDCVNFTIRHPISENERRHVESFFGFQID